MKKLLLPANATFNASAKTITFATTIPASVSHILHVTNVTRGALYFQPQAGAAFTGTFASPVLTLACSTSGHADADKLEIFYDDGQSALAEGGSVNTGLSQPLTDAQIRATALPVSVSGVSTEATLAAQSTLMGAVTETAPASDTASSGLNGRLQRIAQRISSLITALTDRSQKTQITDGTNDVSVSTSIADAMSAAFNRLRVSAVNMAFNGTTVDAVRAGVIGESGAATGYLNMIPATGAVSGASTVGSSAYENSRVLKASAGTAMMIMGYNSKTTTQFIQIHNTTSVPADGAAPAIAPLPVFAQQPFAFSIPTTGMPFTTGITVCNSSTGPTKTIGSADCYFTAVIK